jgi:signal transduction histidine kinase
LFFDHPPADVYAMADEEALRKIFSNLFSNAVKYGHQQIYVRLTQSNTDDPDIVIEMANDGPVIPAEMKERIFEPFYRLKETNKQKGTGIGLALARSLVLLHKGRLFLDDNWPGMNKFVLVLHSNL